MAESVRQRLVRQSAKRRVVFVTITFHPEPGALRGLPLAKSLRDTHGWDVEVITAVPWYPLGRTYPGYRMRLYQREVIDGILVHRLGLYPSHDRSAARRILTYVSFMISALLFATFRVSRAPMIYHVDNLPTTGVAVAWLRLLWRARVVQHIGDLWPDTVLASGMLRKGIGRQIVDRLLHWVMRAVYATNDAITVITEGFRRTLLERGQPLSKVHVSPNWADEERLQPVPEDPALREELGLDGQFVVLYAGNIGILQALEVVLDAAEHMRNDARARFVLIGDGAARPAISASIEARRLEDRVLLLPPRPVAEMPRLNAMSDALLVHLKNETFLHETVPSKTQVSLYAGRPILMGARGEAARIVQDSGAGVVFTPESGSELADAVRTLLALSTEQRDAMGARGRTYYLKHLSLAVGAEAMDKLFSKTLGLAHTPAVGRVAPTGGA